MCTRENELKFSAGCSRIIGIDEAGAGCLAGPVSVCACYFPSHINIPGLNDSKKISPHKREKIYQILIHHPDVKYQVVHINNQEIDQINILKARFKGMFLSYLNLKQILPDIDGVLIDGNQIPPQFQSLLAQQPSLHLQSIIGGDGICPSIAAASIIAKCSRDLLMSTTYHELYPNYHFNQNKGYGTPDHIQILTQIPPCPIHRMTFKRVNVIAPSTH